MKTYTLGLKTFILNNGVLMGLFLMIAFFGILNKNFLSFSNAENILRQVAELGIIAIPLALLLITGMVDLAVGSVASAAAVAAAMTMSATGSVFTGFAVGLIFGAVTGAITGVLVAYLGLNPIVITLGFLSVWGGFALLLTGGRTVTKSELPAAFAELGTARIGPFPLQIVLLVIVILLAWYVLNRHHVGREIYAIGGSVRAAYLMGIKGPRIRFWLFVATGVTSALAGIMLAARTQSASPSLGTGQEMSALTVILLGGVAFAGGAGRVGGVVAGLLFFGVLNNGLVFMQASPFVQTIVIGLTLILAVSLDASIQKAVKNAWTERGKSFSTKSLDKEDSPRATSTV